MADILIVDDERAIADLIELTLTQVTRRRIGSRKSGTTWCCWT